MKRLVVIVLVIIEFSTNKTFAQFGACNCSASLGSGTTNFSSISWTGSGCPTATSTSYTGNLCVDLANGTTLNFDKSSFTITGDFKITNSGNSTFALPSSNSLHVTGNMGDNTNNNVTWTINGSLTVDGTLYGKNSNSFSGTGSYSGGLNFNQAPSGGTGITWMVPPGQCQPSSSSFCTVTTPVTLSFLEVYSTQNEIVLNWTTSSELNFDYFSVEKSLDGLIFSELSQIKGHGTTKEEHHYSYEDKNPIIGRSYYRLTSHDFDGYQEQFPIATVEFNGEKHFEVVPNPSNGNSVAFDLNFELDTESTVVIYDNLGVSFGAHKIGADMRTIIFANPLKSGVYYAKFSSPGFSTVTRFMVRE